MKIILLGVIINTSLFIFSSFPQSGWEVIPSGTTHELNSIYFYDYEVGYACGDSGVVIKSIDSGKTWQSIQTPVTNDLNDLYVFTENALCIVGNLGTTLFSGNGGSTWTVGQSLIQDDLLSVSFSGNIGTCGGANQTILWGTYTGTGIMWIVVQSGFFGGGFWAAYSLTPQIGFVAGENSIFQPLFGKTTDTGATWNFTAFYLNNNEGFATGVDFTDLNTGYVSASVWNGTGAIAKTTDGGTNWNSIIFSNPLWSIDFPVSSASQVGYSVGDAGIILKTFNAGDNWIQQNSGTTSRLNKVMFIDLEFGFAVGDGGIILRTTEGGLPVELTSFSAEVDVRNVVLSWTTATETNNRGFEVEKLFGNDWAPIGFVTGNGTTTEPKSYSFKDEDIETGIHKYRLKQIDYDGTFEYSDIVETEITSPVEFILEQNYPNPFNPSTTISFSIPFETDVRLSAFNALGQEVAVIVNSRLKEGYHQVDFDAGQLTSGIYFYRLEADKFVDVKKMIIIK